MFHILQLVLRTEKISTVVDESTSKINIKVLRTEKISTVVDSTVFTVKNMF